MRRSQATIDTTVTDIERQTAADMARVWETARTQAKEVLAGEIGRAYVEAEKVRESDLSRAQAEISRLGAQIEDDLLQSKRMIAQVRADAESRERNWEADATRKLESAVREARSEAETVATFVFAAEQVRWEKDLKETVAAAVTEKTVALRAALDQATAAGDERLAKRERESHAAAARLQESAVRDALATAETEAAATLAAERAPRHPEWPP